MATFVEMMACAFVPARAVVGGKSAAVGAHAPQVLRAPEPDENAAAEGKPPEELSLVTMRAMSENMPPAATTGIPVSATASSTEGSNSVPFRIDSCIA